MSTRSYIGIENPNGTIEAVYCHFDGYLEGVGKNLLNYWNEESKIREMISLGYLSCLGKEIGEKHDFDNHDTDSGWNLYYGRDRGEINVDFNTYDNFDKMFDAGKNVDAEYIYLFKNGQWHYAEYNDKNSKVLTMKMIEG